MASSEHRDRDRDGERRHRSSHHQDHDRHRRRSSRSPCRDRDDDRPRRRDRSRDRRDHDDRSSRREDRDRKHREDRSKSKREDLPESEEEVVGPAPPPTVNRKLEQLGVAALTSDDYFLKAAEFKLWLSESRGKYLDEIPSKEARRYFDKFVSKWNEGKLGDDFYLGKIRSASAPSSLQTRHKWGFAAKATYSQAEQEALASVRDSVDTMTNAQSRGAIEARAAERAAGKGRRLRGGDEEEDARGSGANAGATDSGWGAKQGSSSSASYADRQYEREAAQEARQREEAASRRRSNRDAKDLAEEFAPRATGRDAMIEKRREKNASNREFASRKEDDGFEVDDATLMGGDDFQRALGARSRGEDKREQRRQERRNERQAEMNEKVSALRSKEKDTMAMFKQLAQQRFGSGA